ncbi:hypothetical protein ACQP2C_05980 [Micromonospora zamorensis]|uniref:hypothetical protein n=1 Tax=Micromonospora zamorensis TaxID=709883 RepID=UPI003D98E6CB
MRTALIVGATLATAVLVDLISGLLVRRVARGRYQWLLEPLRQACRRPAAAVLLAAALHYALPLGPAGWQRHLRHVVLVALIVAGAWLVIKALHVAEALAFSRLPGDAATSLRVRRARTQIRPVRRLTVAVVTIVAIGLILITFRPVRLFGISVLTSAGVVGALIGLSARTALGKLRSRPRTRTAPGWTTAAADGSGAVRTARPEERVPFSVTVGMQQNLGPAVITAAKFW